MVEFAYNNARNINTSHIEIKLNYGYHPCVSFKDDTHPYKKFCLADKLAKELKNVISIYQQSLLYTQELQNRAYDKKVKL